MLSDELPHFLYQDVMLTAYLTYPNIDPVALNLGPLQIRWYSLAYLFGLLVSMWVLRQRAFQKITPYKPVDAIDFLTWATLGMLIGARVGLVLFYYPQWIWERPRAILAIWEGGMSFHGGGLGVLFATIWFARRRKIPLLPFLDEIAVIAPIGLLFGRLANFINAELWGRVTDVPWAMVFPDSGGLPRHPSQLYEAAFEGMLLLLVLNAMRPWAQRRFAPGFLLGLFLSGYSLARFSMEFFRAPDDHLGFLVFGATMGQILSFPMLFVGAWLMYRAVKAGPTGRPWLEAA